MSSGQKRVIINTRERPVSTDIERMQSFIGRTDAELLRFLLFASAIDDTTSGAAETMATTSPVGGPMTMRIVSGVRARPEVGTVNLFVEPGIAVAVDPDAVPHPDDSAAKVIVDGGVSTAGALVLTAGDAALTRIDVVECARTELVIETDSRDQFDASTGLFTAASMNKAAAGALSYRIRLGTPGGGYPGTATGWTPLAVCRVPALATTWNQVTLWDVRPLISDLQRQPFDEASLLQHYGRRQHGIMRNVLPAGATTFTGAHDAQFQRWRAGGFINPAIDLDDTTNVWEPGLVLVNSTPWYIYLVYPFGLPRWVRYVDSPSARVPGSYRGIPVFTQKSPLGLFSTPSAAISIPTGLGLGSNTSLGVVIASGIVSAAGVLLDCVIEDGETTSNDPGIIVTPTLVGGASTFDLLSNTHYPSNATAVRLRMAVDINAAASSVKVMHSLEGYSSDLVNIWTEQRQFTRAPPSGSQWTEEVEHWVPLWPNWPTGLAATHRIISRYTVVGGSPTFSLATGRVLGWRVAM